MNMNSPTSWTGTNLAAAVTNGSYFQFGVSTVPGNQFSIASVAYVAYQQNTYSSSTIVLEYSTNAFVTSGVIVNTNSTINPGWLGTTNTVPLNNFSDLQQIANSITFRLYGYGFQGYADKGLGLVPGDNPDVAVVGSVFYPAAAPTFNPPGGAYSGGQSVAITTTTVGSSINYTTDGSIPTETHGTPYTVAVTVGSNATLQAIAFQTNFVDSAVARASYTITEQPFSISLQKNGPNLQFNWLQGTLLQATNLDGPWTTNPAASPYSVLPTNAQIFYRVRVP
jgi:hypothetical protein